MQMCLCGRGRLARATAGCYSDLRVQRKYEYRRCLPHYQKDSRILFITYSTWHRWNLPEIARDLALDSCLRANGRKYALYAADVMPEHVHLKCHPVALLRFPLVHELHFPHPPAVPHATRAAALCR